MLGSVFLSDAISLAVCVCVRVCVCVCACMNFQGLMEMYSHLRYYICSPGTTPLLPSDPYPDDIPVWPASSQTHDEGEGLIYIILLGLET